MSVAVKVPLVLGSVGAVGTGSYFVITHVLKHDKSKVKLSKKLLDGGFELLSFEKGGTTNDAEGKAILGKYKESGNKDLLEGVTVSSSNDVDNINALKFACSSLVDGEDVSLGNYNKARRWCVVPKRVSEILEKLSKTVLKNEHTNRTDDSLGTKKIGNYNHTILPLPSVEGSKSSDTEKIQELQKGCKALLEKQTKTHDVEFAAEYETAVKGCVS